MTPPQVAALRTEITNDPQGLGYAAFLTSGQDNMVADVLNALRDGVTAAFNGVIGLAVVMQRADIAASEVLEAIDVRDFAASPGGVTNAPLAASWFESVTQARMMRLQNEDLSDTLVLGNLKRLLTNVNGSQGRLTAAAKRSGSRAEKLFGAGTVMQPLDVAQALRGSP